ncbi:hypothetical protein H2203_005777 [Taxawa tesnikishii (nom. ined.)]|nr:hypothetical protein H2203_005777 [Dothideales sp. JES 119]
MHVSKAVLTAFFAYPFLTLAQVSGNFNNYQNPFKPLTLNWTPTTSGTITLILRSGASNNLNAGTIIASGIDNSGSYTWTPSDSITRGSDYTVEIVDDSNPSNTNYTPYFVLESSNTVAYTTSDVSVGAPSSSIMVATASNTLSVTPSATAAASSVASSGSSVTSGTATAASVSSAISSANSVLSSAASSASAAVASLSSSVASLSSSVAQSGSTMTTSASRTASSTSSQAGLQASASSSSTATGAAPRVTAAAAGLIGLVAFGAMAL